jgi:hypothetical protein
VLVPDKREVWMYCNGFRDLEGPWTTRTCERRQIWAFRSIEVGVTWNKKKYAAAAIHGHLEILQWFWEQGCVWDSDTPWNSTTCTNAALNGHLEFVKVDGVESGNLYVT